MEVETFLQHYGVRGMHWGVRRKNVTKKEQRVRDKRQKVSENRRHISDGDLDKYVKRLEQEKKLKTLVEEDLNPGKSAAKKLITASGTKVASTVIAGAGVYAVRAVLEKKFDPIEASKHLKPKSK